MRRILIVQRALSTRGLMPLSGAQRLRNAVASVASDGAIDGPIWAISMVRDEQDIIDETVMNLLDQGIDHVLIANNLSTDETRPILERLAKRHPVHIVDDPIHEYWQAEKMTLLARAATRFGASWIVPFDADELWRGLSGTVRETLHSATTPVVRAQWFDYVPIDHGGGSYAERFPYRIAEPARLPKVAFRANWLARIVFGSHAVTLPDTSQETALRIAHFRFRSTEQMEHKARLGADAVRAAGLSSSRRWFALADGTTSADAMLESMRQRDDLVLDPVAG